MEKEFWKILSTPTELLSVKYGADLHTLDVGSGFQCDDTANTKVKIASFFLKNKTTSLVFDQDNCSLACLIAFVKVHELLILVLQKP